VITAADPEPETHDPFDRRLLAQCQAENLQLATIDRALMDPSFGLESITTQSRVRLC
jgi:PIN domain nuclease of toxin-antitoxin system